jgi:predicted DNA-binding transcriptional regulator AlpA
LVATPEIAELLEVSRQRADVITKQVGFPEPVASLSVGKIWRESDVKRWISMHRPTKKTH